MEEKLYQEAIDKIEKCECLNEDEYRILVTLADNTSKEGKKARRAFFLSSLNDNKAFSFLTARDENKEEYYAGYGRRYL